MPGPEFHSIPSQSEGSPSKHHHFGQSLSQTNGDHVFSNGYISNGANGEMLISYNDPRLFIKPLNLSDKQRQMKVETMLQKLKVDDATMWQIYNVFNSELELGLAKDPPRKSSLQMENTFIPKLPNGTEHGDYMALDLGGTNFRVILLKLRNGQIMAEIVKYFHVPEEIQLGPGHNLFDFLAECIKEFMTEHEILDKTFPLGFCFSFPMDHISLRAATLTSWTKSFKCSGVVGEEVVQMLNDALADKGISVDVCAVLNDTTGTLISGAQTDQKCAIGLILGTGSNACYIERTDRIPKWEGDHEEQEVIIDIEWGAFGDNGVLDFLKTDYDRDVDAHSVNPSIFTFEKYFSGKFLGEVVRYILVALTREGLLFNGHGSEKLFKPNTFGTANISKIEEDTLEGTAILNLEHILEDLSISFDNEDADIIQYVCAIVSDRAARLISSCLANLINRMEKPTPSIAVDGSLYKYHPRLRFLMEYYMQRMTRPDIKPENATDTVPKFKFIQAEDGSGKGAGLMAAIARRLEATTK